MSKYSVQNETIQNLIAYIENKELLIPEIQRPFVWKSTKVRDLIDSLYRGYPIGYIITWKNEDAKVKDGKNIAGSKLIIDGQQRITAISTAIVGKEVLDSKFKKAKISISFNPNTEEFATKTPAIEKDKNWIIDISVIYSTLSSHKIINDYLKSNPEANEDIIAQNIGKLYSLKQAQIGVINLGYDFTIEEIADIFERINSAGTQLKQQDFVMSKIASTDRFDGVNIRKIIDYFSHLSSNKEDLNAIKNDSEFNEEYLNKIKWITKKSKLIYKMNYNDILRVVYTYKFARGRMKYFVPLLSGRDFEKRENSEEIAEENFKALKEGVLECVNQTNYERFTMIIKSLGFIDSSFITSKTSINFSYSLYLYLRSKNISENKIEKIVSKWFVFSVLSYRYMRSAETEMEADIKNINEMDIDEFVDNEEKNQISENFWENTIPSDLETSSTQNARYRIFLAYLVKNNSKAFLSKDILVRDMLDDGRGDIHHIYPKSYLAFNDVKMKGYNQVANYVYCEQSINIKLSNLSPKEYLEKSTEEKIINIQSKEELKRNFDNLAIPDTVLIGTIDNYELFLKERRKLISYKIKEYYEAL